MSQVQLNNLVDLLCDLRLLGPDELSEVRHCLLSRYSDQRSLAKHLIQRGWLTVYQVNQLLQDQGEELILGPCRILDRLGEGAISQVFKAWHVEKRCLVALKVLRPGCESDLGAAGQFEREIEVLTQFSHPHVVKAVDAGRARATRFLALEYIEGTDLERFVRLSGPLPAGHACDYVLQAALGLHHAHARGIVHRDVKPSNLFLSSPAYSPRRSSGRSGLKLVDQAEVKVLDWGLALTELSDDSSEAAASALPSGALVGTADTMAPEQARDPQRVDGRADIYSLGCTFYFLLTGQPPFPGNSLMQKLLQHEQAEPPAVIAVRPDLPPPVALVLQKMMAKRPSERPSAALSVAAALAPFCRTSRSADVDTLPDVSLCAAPGPEGPIDAL